LKQSQHMRPHRLAWSRTPAFHAGDRGSNPLGDATYSIKGLQEIVSPFLMPIFYRPHHYPHYKRGQLRINYFVLALRIEIDFKIKVVGK
jgi:hypothetical protein